MTLHQTTLVVLLTLSLKLVGGPLPERQIGVADAVLFETPGARFQPASFKGILFGRSKRDDVVKRFGMPKTEELGQDGDIHLTYDNVWLEKGNVEVLIDSKSLSAMDMVVYPKNVSLRQLSRILGNDYVDTRWEFAVCMNDGGTSPLYMSATGQFLYREYRAKGIVVSVEKGSVKFIEYRSTPLGYSADPCKGRRERLRDDSK